MNTALTISIIAILLSYLESKNVFKYGLIAGMALITVFVAIRYEWGTDMPNYFRSFQVFSDSGYSVFELNKLSQIRDTRAVEIGWAILNVLFRPIGFFGMVILLAVIENYIIYDSIRRYIDKRYYWLALSIYTMNPYMMVLGCSMLRQWLAMCIIIYAIRYILSSRLWMFVLFVLLATTIHTSALVFLILYPIQYVYIKKMRTGSFTWICILSFLWLLIGGFFASFGATALIGMDVFEGYDSYVAESQGGSLLGFGGFFKIALSLFCVYQASKINESKSIWCWLLLVFLFLFPLTGSFNIANRLNLYVEAIGIISIPMALSVNKEKIVNVVIIGLLFFLNWTLYKGFFASPSFHLPYLHYRTIFEVPWQ